MVDLFYNWQHILKFPWKSAKITIIQVFQAKLYIFQQWSIKKKL